MLTSTAPTSASRRLVGRSTVWRSMLRPTLRVSRLGLVAATVLLGCLPLFVTIVRNGSDLVTPLTVLGLVSGASIGWIADDPIAELAAPCPVNTPRRIACRAALAGGTVAFLTAGAVVIAVVDGAGVAEWRDRVPEVAAAAAIALAVGLSIGRRGEPLGGASGVTAGVLVPPFVAAFAFRWPSMIPSFAAAPTHARWWALAAVAGFVACRAARDPARGALLRSAGANP